MFLANLENQQKTSFLSLAQALISADGVLSKDEAALMAQYQQEMALTMPAEVEEQAMDLSIGVFKSASHTVKKQVMFELVALACADSEYAEEERRLLEKIGDVWGLDITFLDECLSHVQELISLYGRIGELVSE